LPSFQFGTEAAGGADELLLEVAQPDVIGPTIRVRFVAAMQARQQKITLAEMRASGVRSLLIYCADYHCSHAIEIVSALCTLCNSSAVR
jgi:hypothetical protein